jgi:hypothetical protein
VLASHLFILVQEENSLMKNITILLNLIKNLKINFKAEDSTIAWRNNNFLNGTDFYAGHAPGKSRLEGADRMIYFALCDNNYHLFSPLMLVFLRITLNPFKRDQIILPTITKVVFLITINSRNFS